MNQPANQPLKGIRVLDFGHTVMGPSCTMVLADLGAEVIKIEPAPAGDPTRKLAGFGLGYFGYFNRNKQSLSIDLKSEQGREAVLKLIAESDVLVENFAPGTMDRLGLGYDTLSAHNPRLIYVSLKGFLDGPYRDRLALDEVVQMMSGLAYMTGPSGRPLRAGTSVIDIAGGMFGVIGTLIALGQREKTGKGQQVESALFETAVFMMGQHLCYAAQLDKPIPPMPERVSAWAVYEPFTLLDGRQLFVGITTDQHWARFCKELGREELIEDPLYRTNNLRIENRKSLLPIVAAIFAGLDSAEATTLCEACRIPFAPIARPEDLFDDPHLKATGALYDTVLPNGVRTRLPSLPLHMGAAQTGYRNDPPMIGQDSKAVLASLGYGAEAIAAMIRQGIVVDGAAAQEAADSSDQKERAETTPAK
jgi:crotonobetainyl-CoA:carnitine CoA-transferase CaiB-like acyl-CoA transferase